MSYANSIGLRLLARNPGGAPPWAAKSDTLSRVPAAVSHASSASERAAIVSNLGIAPRHHILVLLALTAIYVASYAFSIAIPDSTRDIYIARAISVGDYFPLEGPVLGDAVHGGPVWFYLLAVPLWFYKSWLVAALFAGVIAGLKYLLAYVCGSHLVDRRFGLLWALALALPGWSTIEQIAFTNANVAETCVLASLYFGIRVHERPGLWRVCLLGIASGVAFHGHPTTLAVIPLALGAVMFASPPQRRATAALVFVAGCVAPFAPYLVSQWIHGFPDFASGVGYVQTKVGVGQIANVLGILRSTAFDGPVLIARYIVDVDEPLLSWVKAGVACLVVASVLAAFWSARLDAGKRMLWLALASAAVFVVVVASLRPTTPVYFVYALIPSLAAVLALGAYALARAGGAAVVAAFAAIVIALHGLVAVRIGAAMGQGVGTLPDVGNVAASAPSDPSTNVWFPSYAHDDSGLFLCRNGDRMAVHGPLAFLADLNVGVDTLIRCGRASPVQLSGTIHADRTHWVGMPKFFWTVAQLRPRCWIGPLGLANVSLNLAPARDIAPASPRAFLPRPFLQGPSRERSIAFTTSGRQALVLTNVIPWYMPWRVLSVHANGRELSPLASTAAAQLYALPDDASGDAARWEVAFAAPDTDMIDVVTVDSAARTEAGSPACVDQS
jgi:hypothetical protein